MQTPRNDEYSLESQRKFNRRLILNHHRFLFENDDGCLSWLLEHDPFFVESLVKKPEWREKVNKKSTI